MLKKTLIGGIVAAVLVVAMCVPVSASSWTEYSPTMADLFPNGFAFDDEYTQGEVYWDGGSAVADTNAFYGTAGIGYWIPSNTPKGAFTLQFQMTNMGYNLSAGDTFIFASQFESTVYEELGSNPTVKVGFFNTSTSNGSTYNTLVFAREFTPPLSSDGRYRQQLNIEYTASKDVLINNMVVLVKVGNRPVTGTGTGGRLRVYFKSISVGYGNKTEQHYAEEQGEDTIGALREVISTTEANNMGVSVKKFVAPLSYTGTAAKWSIPPITIPAIPGVMDKLQLTDSLEVDFEYWIKQMPSTVLEVVQIVCTLALVMFCFRELYKTISYVLTLRGGGASE